MAVKKTFDERKKRRITFRQVLESLDGFTPAKFRTGSILPPLLAEMPYKEEKKFKIDALKRFWELSRLPGMPDRIFWASHPRNYQTTSNRRLFESGNRFYLFSPDRWARSKEVFFQPSTLEPEAHAAIYSLVIDLLNRPPYKMLSRQLNFLTIRGSNTEFSVIFNMRKLDSALVRKLKNIAEHLKKMDENVISMFIHASPMRTGNYLGFSQASGQTHFKKLFGPERLFLKTATQKFSYSPVVFSPLNLSMVQPMLEKAESLLNPSGSEILIDIYCGYGLFSLALAEHYEAVFGIDSSLFAIDAANDNFLFAGLKGKTVEFIGKGINGSTIKNKLPENELLDEVFIINQLPDALGRGVVKAITERKPKKILHLFHSIDDMPARLGEWRSNGYRFKRVIPLDAYAGVPVLSAMVLLQRGD